MQQGKIISLSEHKLAASSGELRALFKLTDRLYRAASIEEAYAVSLDAIEEALGCARASILRFDSQGVMRFVAWRGLSDEYMRAVSGHSPWRPGERDALPISIADIEQAADLTPLRPVLEKEGIRSLSFIPLTLDDAVIGKFMLYRCEPHATSDNEIQIALTIARQLGFTIEREADNIAVARLAAIVESSNDAIVSKDLRGIVMTWNRGAERLFGYTAPEMIGKPITLLIPPERSSEEAVILGRISAGERIDSYETVRMRKDGSLVDVSLTVSPILGPNRRVIGVSKIARDITERRREQDRRQIILREMNHRVKNLFALTSSIVSMNARYVETPGELAAALVRRLKALADAHALTMAVEQPNRTQGDQQTSLHQLVQTILAPYSGASADAARLVLNGPDLPIGSKAITPLALLLHESATNAAKYGSLSVPEGHVELSVTESGEEITLTWQERGGPAIQGPGEEGFGSKLFMATAAQLDGQVMRDWHGTGLRLMLALSRRSLTG